MSQQNRLRSESAPDADRSARVMANRRRSIETRFALKADCERRLIESLGGPVTDFAMQLIVEQVVSATVDFRVLSAKFYQGRASSSEMERLGVARGALLRGLRALGLPRPTDDSNRAGSGTGLADYLARRSQAEHAAAAVIEGDPDGTS